MQGQNKAVKLIALVMLLAGISLAACAETTSVPPTPSPRPQPSPTATPTPERQWGYRAMLDSTLEVFEPVGKPNRFTCHGLTGVDPVTSLDVYFERPLSVQAVNLNYLSKIGADPAIQLIYTDGSAHELNHTVELTTSKCPWIYHLEFESTATAVIGIRLPLSTNALAGWNALDAVELIGMPVGEALNTDEAFFPTATPAPMGERAFRDRPDDQKDRYQLHVVYALFAGDMDRQRDLDGSIARSLRLANDWFAEQTGGPRLRLDTFHGELDITFVQFAETAAEALEQFRPRYELRHRSDPRWVLEDYYMDYLEAKFVKDRLYQDGKYYIVYLERKHPHSCGYSRVSDIPGVFFLGTSDCGYGRLGVDAHAWNTEFVLVHEVLHGLGYVAACAPHSIPDNPSHVNDSAKDLLYPYVPEGQQQTLDVGNDDYFRHDISDCPDLQDSVFLDPLPESPAVPEGWPPYYLLPR